MKLNLSSGHPKASGRFLRWGASPAIVKPSAPTDLKCVPVQESLSARLSGATLAIPHLQVRRFDKASFLQKRGASGGRTVRGLAMPYGVPIGNVGGYNEIVTLGAFAESLDLDDPRVLFNHNVNMVLGRKSAGTARFWEEADGLHYEADVPGTSWGDDLLISMERGDVDGADAACYVQKFEWGKTDGKMVRYITKALLMAASVSTFSSCQGAQADTDRLIKDAEATGFKKGAEAMGEAVLKANAQRRIQNAKFIQ